MYSASSASFPISSLKARRLDSRSSASRNCVVSLGSDSKVRSSRIVMGLGAAAGGDHKPKVVMGEAGYVLEDVPHLSDYIPDLPVRRTFFPSFSVHVAKLTFVYSIEMKGD